MKYIKWMLVFLPLFLATASCKQREKRETKFENGQTKEQFEVLENKEGSYLKDGKYISYYSNGQKSEESSYKDDKLDGDCKRWFENGKLKAEIKLRNGMLEGEYKQYLANGELLVANYNKDTLEGNCTGYLNEKLTLKGSFKSQKAHGNWVAYNQKEEKIGEVEMQNGNYKTPVTSYLKNTDNAGCCSFRNFKLNHSTYPEVKLGFLDHNYFPVETIEPNKFTKGRMLAFNGSSIGSEDLKLGHFIFDKEDVLVAVVFTMPQGASSKYGGGFMANFKAMRDLFAKDYKLIEEKIPFVGNSYAKYSNGNCYILVDAPHLSFDMTVYYWVNGYADALADFK